MAERNLERYGDLNPPIVNCGGGLQNDSLHGELTSDQVLEVKSIPKSSRFEDQGALSLINTCDHSGEVEIMYYPGSEYRFEPITVVEAVCSQVDCEYNASGKK